MDQDRRSLRIASFLSGSALAFAFAHWLGVVDLSPRRHARRPKPIEIKHQVQPPQPKATPRVMEHVPDPDPADAPSTREAGRKAPMAREGSAKPKAEAPTVAKSPPHELTQLLLELRSTPQDVERRVAFEDAMLSAAEALHDTRVSAAIQRCVTQADLMQGGPRAVVILEQCFKRFESRLTTSHPSH